MSTAPSPVLRVRGLSVAFASASAEYEVVSDVDLGVERGRTLAVVGESGCGKSVTALAVMGLIEPPGRILRGSVQLEGRELVGLPVADYRALRGDRIGMVFQEPMTSLNPVFRVGEQIAEVLRRHRDIGRQAAREQTIDLLQRVNIPSPQRRVDQYPHELSGGMKQRVMIAMALACSPSLLIADEPTTALDVTVQAQIMHLLQELQAEMGMAMVLISHNLGLVARYADQVAVMYAGRVVEQAPVAALFEQAAHPYTRALLASLPRPGRRRDRLEAIAGTVPAPSAFPPGCRFSQRCPQVLPHCEAERPPRVEVETDHQAECWLLRAESGR